MEISHQSDGGVRTTISSHNKTESEQEFNVTGSVTRSIEKLNEYAREYGIDIDNEKISLVEDKSKNSIPLATDESINNITFTAQLFENPTIYSFNEQRIGVWVDGSVLYQKAIHIPTLPNSTTLEIDADVEDLYEIIDFRGYCRPKDKASFLLSYTRPLPNPSPDSINTIRVDSQNGYVRVITASNWSTYEGFLIIRYTKK